MVRNVLACLLLTISTTLFSSYQDNRTRQIATDTINRFGGSSVSPFVAIEIGIVARNQWGSGPCSDKALRDHAYAMSQELIKKANKIEQLASHEIKEVLTSQKNSIENVNSQGLLAYLDPAVNLQRLQQGVDGKIKNRPAVSGSAYGECSICSNSTTVQPFSCGNNHPQDTWACQKCQYDNKMKFGTCPFCRASLR